MFPTMANKIVGVRVRCFERCSWIRIQKMEPTEPRPGQRHARVAKAAAIHSSCQWVTSWHHSHPVAMLKLQLMHCNPRENSAFVPGTGTGTARVTVQLPVTSTFRRLIGWSIVFIFWCCLANQRGINLFLWCLVGWLGKGRRRNPKIIENEFNSWQSHSFGWQINKQTILKLLIDFIQLSYCLNCSKISTLEDFVNREPRDLRSISTSSMSIQAIKLEGNMQYSAYGLYTFVYCVYFTSLAAKQNVMPMMPMRVHDLIWHAWYRFHSSK